MSLYSAWNVGVTKLNFAGQDISDGKGVDTWISFARSAPRATHEAGLDGNIAPSISLDNSAIMTVTYVSVSDNGKVLRNLYQALREADKKTSVNGSATLSISDPSNTVLFFGQEAMLYNLGDEEFSASIPTVSVDFLIADMKSVSVPTTVAAKINAMLPGIGVVGTTVQGFDNVNI